MKRSVLLSFALFIGASLSAQNTADFQYTASNGAVTITGYTGSAKNVTIPERIDGLPVTAIGRVAFREKQLTNITIPDSVTTIGEGAFYINQLTSVIVPNSVTTIGRAAFWQNSLTSVTIPANVNITDDPFEENLTQVYTSGGNRAGTYQFRDGTSGFAQYAGDFAYTANNSAVTITGYTGSEKNVTIPERIDGLPVTVIGDRAFSNNQLTSMTIPNSVTTIGEYAFSTNRLISVTIPNSVTTIGGGAFRANRLTCVTIPNSVKTIGETAFSDNPLTSVTIPANVTILSVGWVASFPGNLGFVYTRGGSRVGTYLSNDGGETWTRQQ